jgi:putative endonuclease
MRAQRRGRWAEALARLYLRVTGWRILGANIKSPVGEIDIIAKRGNLIAFIEVKTRASAAAAGAAIGPAQQRRIARAAEAFLGQRPNLQNCDIRFDAILISGPLTLRHHPDAWRS